MPRKIVTNPFGSDSDEDENGEGFSNPFATRKPAAPSRPSVTIHESKSAMTTNPFDQEDDVHNDGNQKSGRHAAVSSSAAAAAVATTTTVPREGGPFQAAKKASSTNPFDATASDSSLRPSPSVAMAANTAPTSSSFPSMPLNPSSIDTKPKHPSIASKKDGMVTTFDSNLNPFGSTVDDVFAAPSKLKHPPELSQQSQKQQQTQRHVRRQTTNTIHTNVNTNIQQQRHQTSTSLFEFPELDFHSSSSDPKKGSMTGKGEMIFPETSTNGSGGPIKKSIFARRKTTSVVTSTTTSTSATGTSVMFRQEPLANAVDQEEERGGNVNALETSPVKPKILGNHSRSKSDGLAWKAAGTAASDIGNIGEEKEGSLSGWLRGAGGGTNAKVAVASQESRVIGTPSKGTRAKQTIMNKLTPGRKKNEKKVKDKKKKRNFLVQCWPYDDYHKDQEKYYESIQERDMGNETPTRRRRSDVLGRSGGESFGYNSGSEEDNDDDNNVRRRRDEIRGYAFQEGGMFERPQDLPSIKEAVQKLNLFDFEAKAKERAISIVSTWLFDSGLIDELLVNGGSGYGAGNSAIANMNMSGSNSVAGYSVSISSVRSSEGVEVGAHGFPIEGGLKIDKEAEKLRVNTQRELTLINTRLNDGVSASGSEVQELVNAVSTTKSELGRLKELATYISSGYKNDSKLANSNIKDGIILSDYPRLKRAINARRNIFRCFRELEFFSQIPLTCDRLREELHQGEWTANEWNTIRNVCMEHVELEILLVEAEAGMKAWLDDEDDGDDESSMPSLRSNKSLKKSWKGRQQTALLAGNHQVVDEFLSQHVKNVWELGDEIRMRILSGVGSAYDLALQNPAGMVALVEAVEVYERAADQFKAARGGEYESDKNHLRFTDMRAAALAQLYQDFELRGLEVFRAIHMQAADMADESDALNSQFNAVLRAATELVTEIDVVKNQMAPCFAPHWHVEMLWSSCVAHVCSNQIIQQIGGPEGQNLPDLSVTQLLDLVAWVEFFRETIEDAFPSIGSVSSKKTYFDERPDLFAGNHKVVNMENAKDSLAWVNNMLWEVHRLAQDEFLLRTRSQSDEWITKVYSTKHETTQTREGRLVTSLCEDIFSLASVQLRTIRERLTKKSDALVMAVCLIFTQLRSKQLSSRNTFLTDLESCCAAANDFQRMSEQVEDMVNDLIDHSELPESSVKMLEDSCGALVSLYSGDAVYAAQRAHGFIFEPIEEAIANELFGPKWEVELTHNELAMTLTRTLDDFMGDLETFLDEFMLKKTVDALVASTVVFYVKSLLLKAEKHNNNKQPYFGDTVLALERMDRDIKVMRDYFDGLAEAMPALGKVIEKEFAVLTTLQELIRIAAGISDSDASDFILVLHKRVKDINITKHVVGDLWHLVQPTEERAIWEQTESLEESLLAVCPPDNNKIANNRMTVPGLRLDETLAKLCIESKRKRPIHASVVENMLGSLKKNWATTEVDLAKKNSM